MQHAVGRGVWDGGSPEFTAAHASRIRGSPTAMTLSTSPACLRKTFGGNIIENKTSTTFRAGSGRRPSSERSRNREESAYGEVLATSSYRPSSATRDRDQKARDEWVENSGFATEFRRRREDIARRRRAMMGVTRAMGPHSAGGMDYEALADENQRLKQALNEASDENRRHRVNSARLEEELLRSDGKIKMLFAELDRVPSMRNQRLVDKARCEVEKCAVVRTLVQQRKRLQQMLTAQDKEMETLRRTQESSTIAEMTAGMEEYFLEIQRLNHLLGRLHLGLSPVTGTPESAADRAFLPEDFAATRRDKMALRESVVRCPTNHGHTEGVCELARSPIDDGRKDVAPRYLTTFSPLSPYQRDRRRVSGTAASAARRRAGHEVFEGESPVHLKRHRNERVVEGVVAWEILEAELTEDFESAARRRRRPQSPMRRRSPPQAAQMAPRTMGRAMPSRRAISHQRRSSPRTQLRRPDSQNILRKGSPEDNVSDGNVSSNNVIRKPTRSRTGGRARPLSAPSRRRSSSAGDNSSRQKKAQGSWGHSSNRTLSSWTGEGRGGTDCAQDGMVLASERRESQKYIKTEKPNVGAFKSENTRDNDSGNDTWNEHCGNSPVMEKVDLKRGAAGEFRRHSSSAELNVRGRKRRSDSGSREEVNNEGERTIGCKDASSIVAMNRAEEKSKNTVTPSDGGGYGEPGSQRPTRGTVLDGKETKEEIYDNDNENENMAVLERSRKDQEVRDLSADARKRHGSGIGIHRGQQQDRSSDSGDDDFVPSSLQQEQGLSSDANVVDLPRGRDSSHYSFRPDLDTSEDAHRTETNAIATVKNLVLTYKDHSEGGPSANEHIDSKRNDIESSAITRISERSTHGIDGNSAVASTDDVATDKDGSDLSGGACDVDAESRQSDHVVEGEHGRVQGTSATDDARYQVGSTDPSFDVEPGSDVGDNTNSYKEEERIFGSTEGSEASLRKESPVVSDILNPEMEIVAPRKVETGRYSSDGTDNADAEQAASPPRYGTDDSDNHSMSATDSVRSVATAVATKDASNEIPERSASVPASGSKTSISHTGRSHNVDDADECTSDADLNRRSTGGGTDSTSSRIEQRSGDGDDDEIETIVDVRTREDVDHGGDMTSEGIGDEYGDDFDDDED